ncbi:DUF2007 domain-containing protein [Haloferula sp. BvORR071]|uniref:putative signal transducing protein n=1 Tax=Haloferula sp. BvORR071 TaxID=1396141 RepID=UPI0006979650|nr:DUF2007 domain-containing protein [Haloferula sp. BvORR071]
MKELFRERNQVALSRYQSLLEAAGIPTFIRNENLSQLEAPIPAFMPVLCVVNDEDLEKAVALIRENQQEAAEAPVAERKCAACGEMNPGSFEICWNCGADLAAQDLTGV